MSKYGLVKVGSKVKTLRELRNGVSIIPKGSVGEVKKLYAGIEIYFENKCEHCHFGERIWINRVPLRDVELVLPAPSGKE